MKPGGLLLLLGSFVLCTGLLLAAPPARRDLPQGQRDKDCPAGCSCDSGLRGKRLCRSVAAAPPLAETAGVSSFSTGSQAGRQEQVTSKGKAASRIRFLCILLEDTEVAPNNPLLKEWLENQEGKTVSQGNISPKETALTKEDTLAPREVGPPATEKPRCEKTPRPGGRLRDSTDTGPSVESKPAEKLQVGSDGEVLINKKPQLGVGMVSGENPPSRGNPMSVGSPTFTPKLAFSEAGLITNKNATSGHKPISGGKPATDEKPDSNIQHGKPTSASAEKPVLGTGHTTHGKPISSEKPASAAEHAAHVKPTSGEKPTSGTGQMAHPKPTHSQGKPQSGEKPAPEKKPKPEDQPEKDASNGNKEEVFDDAFDVDDDSNEGGTSDTTEGEEDGFDKELDYGLNESPFNAYAYHDAWSHDGSGNLITNLVAAKGGPSEVGGGSNDGEPVLGVSGDAVRRTRSEPQPRKPFAKIGSI